MTSISSGATTQKLTGFSLVALVPALSLALSFALSPVAASAATIFSDSFGTGSTDTTFDESPTWSEGGRVGDDAEKRAAGSDNNPASPDGDRFATMFGETGGSDGDGYICRVIDATGYSDVALSYHWRGDDDAESGDIGIVEFRTGPSTSACGSNSSAWTALQSHDLSEDGSWTTQAPFTNAGFDDETFLLRFKASSSADDEHFRVDGILVSGGGPETTGSLPVPKGGGGGPPGGQDRTPSADGFCAASGVATTTSAGGHVVSEDPSEGYAASFSGDCDSEGTVTVVAQQEAECTITNTWVPTTGTLVVIKNVVGPDGQSDVEDSTLFTVWLNGDATSSDFAEGSSATFYDLAPGEYTISESSPEGYQLIDIDPSTTTEVSAGATTTVTVTNRQISLTGSLTVTKVVEGGELGVQDFALYVDGFSVTSGVATTTAAGNHEVSEGSEDGYEASFGGDCDGSGNVSVPAAGSATCTITNTWLGTGSGTIVIIKDTEPNDPQDFYFTIEDEEGGDSFHLDDYNEEEEEGYEDQSLPNTKTYEGMPAGTYTVTEGEDSFFDLTYIVCDDPTENSATSTEDRAATISLSAGETVTCTFTNTGETPPTSGGIVVIKNVVAQDYETDVSDSTTFTVWLDGATSSSVSEESEASFYNLAAGEYVITEDELAGYGLVSISPATATVEIGATTTVTATNRQLGESGTLIIYKDVVGIDGQSDVADGASFTVVIDGEMGVSVAEGSPAIFEEISFGSHTISENPQEGYELVSISPTTTVVVSVGSTTIVTVTNRQLFGEGEGR